MVKTKIAISIDKGLVELVDSNVDGLIIRSRSQAIELYLKRGIEEKSVDTAVLLVHKKHHACSVKQIRGVSLIKHQLELFYRSGINKVYIVTQHSKQINLLVNEILNAKVNVELVEEEVEGNAQALLALKPRIKGNFVVMSGDVFNNFELSKMIKKHLESGIAATMGLMTRDKPSSYGNVVLDGDMIIDFEEKPKKTISPVVNAGIYIFKPTIFNQITVKVKSLEKDLFQRLAKKGQLQGYFTHGEYVHVSEDTHPNHVHYFEPAG